MEKMNVYFRRPEFIPVKMIYTGREFLIQTINFMEKD